jgi:hypothetical protein
LKYAGLCIKGSGGDLTGINLVLGTVRDDYFLATDILTITLPVHPLMPYPKTGALQTQTEYDEPWWQTIKLGMRVDFNGYNYFVDY